MAVPQRGKAELTDQEALLLDGWIKNYPLLGEAYRIKVIE